MLMVFIKIEYYDKLNYTLIALKYFKNVLEIEEWNYYWNKGQIGNDFKSFYT